MRKIAVSGFFDPVHAGHLSLFVAAKSLGDWLTVIVNNDRQQKLKGSIPFMPLEERIRLIEALKPVDEVVVAFDADGTVCETLRFLKPDVFANGGDRGVGNVPEADVCRKLGIEMAYGIGGEKIRSSSELIREATKKAMGMDASGCTVNETVGETHQGSL